MDGQISQQETPPQNQAQGTSGLAIAGLVLGVLAVLASFVPIVNNGAFFVAIIGFVLAIVGKSQAKKRGQGGGIAVAGIVLNILAVVITLMVQAACSAALESATSNGTGTIASSSASTASVDESGEEAAQQADTANMAIGQTIDMDNGLSITVNSASTGLVNFDDSTVTGISVTIVNNGTSGESFSEYDWMAEDANGTQRDVTYYSEAVEELDSGTLSPGGTVTGNIYFDEPVAKVYYYSNVLSSDSNIAWVIS